MTTVQIYCRPTLAILKKFNGGKNHVFAEKYGAEIILQWSRQSSNDNITNCINVQNVPVCSKHVTIYKKPSLSPSKDNILFICRFFLKLSV